jgi:RNA polymerase sigma factor (sigma-70 family)
VPWTVLHEDLVSAGYLGLIHAADRYTQTDQATFWTFAGYRVYGSMMDFLRDNTGKREYRQLRAERMLREIHLSPEVYSVPSPDNVHDDYARQEQADIIRRATVDRRERLILDGIRKEMTNAAIGELLGVNESRVSQIKWRMVRRMKQRYGLQRHHIRLRLIESGGK